MSDDNLGDLNGSVGMEDDTIGGLDSFKCDYLLACVSQIAHCARLVRVGVRVEVDLY